MQLKKARISDLQQMQELFVQTIETVCTEDYTEKQLKIWSSAASNTARWENIIHEQKVILSSDGSVITGFGTLRDYTYIDMLYVHKDYQGRGVASLIYREIEQAALSVGSVSLTSDVSITAKPFFQSRGFRVIAEQRNILQRVEIINYKMQKILR